MGWESRDWGQWTDEERETYLDGRERRQPLTTAQLVAIAGSTTGR